VGFWTAKRRKILSHESFPNAQASLWIDGNVRVLENPLDLANKYLSNNDLAVYKHPHRSGIYNEGLACIKLGKGRSTKIRTQMEHYRQCNFPEHCGLRQCTVIFRRHTPQVKQFEQRWWREIQRFSARDQISFPFVVRKTGINVNALPKDAFREDFYWSGRHAK